MKPIVLCVTAASSYRLLRILAAHLVDERRAVAYLVESNPNAGQIRVEAAGMGIPVYELVLDVNQRWVRPVLTDHPRPWVARFLNALARIIQPPNVTPRVASAVTRRIWGSDLTLLRRHRDELGARLAAAIELFRKIDPAALVVSEDGISAPLPILTAARHLKVPVVDVPYGYGVQRDLELTLDSKQTSGALLRPRGLCGLLIKWLTPQWIKRGPFAGVVMFPSPYIVAAESLGMTLRDAWIVHGGYSRVLCAESEQMRDLYLSEGIPADKLALTGTPYCDTLLNAFAVLPAAKQALRQPRKIQPGRTRILVAWPPSYHSERSAHNEFPSYRDMSVTILGWLAAVPNCDVTVSLHPATLDADREAVKAAGVTLTDTYVIDLIAAHDVFVTYFSSTIRWAIAAGKPVVNYDAYKLGLNVYDAAPGVRTLDSFAKLKQTVTDLAGSDTAFGRAAEGQIAVAEHWGMLDGQNTARVAAAICA